MLRPLRTLISVVFLAAMVWCSFTVPLGERTFAEHMDRIGQTSEAKELMDGTRSTLTPALEEATHRMLGEHIEAPTRDGPPFDGPMPEGPALWDGGGLSPGMPDSELIAETSEDLPVSAGPPKPSSMRAQRDASPAHSGSDSAPSTPERPELPGREG